MLSDVFGQGRYVRVLSLMEVVRVECEMIFLYEMKYL